jgi:hypothetical protein
MEKIVAPLLATTFIEIYKTLLMLGCGSFWFVPYNHFA